MDAFPFFLVVLSAALSCAVLARVVAESKGHSGGLWALVGFFLGPLGLIAAAGLADFKAQRFLRLLADPDGKCDPPLARKTSISDREAAFLRGIQEAAERSGL